VYGEGVQGKKGGETMKLKEGPGRTIIMLKRDLVHRVMGLIRAGQAGKNPWGVPQATWIAEAERMGLKGGKSLVAE
jgi:hypothetical protein